MVMEPAATKGRWEVGMELDVLGGEANRAPPVVLVMDDNPALRLVLRRLLELGPLQAQVLEASDGVAGLKIVMERSVDCVLADLNMPVMDGATFLRAVRARFSRLELPVLVLTSKDAAADRVHGLKCGASDFVSKPFEAEEVVLRTETQVNLSRMHRQLTKLVRTDPLTGLGNRRTFGHHLGLELARAKRSGHTFSMLMLDIDHFKSINDTLGHPAGDAVLVSLARLLEKQFRPYDVVARLGGEEFAVLLPDASLEKAVAAAERLRTAIQSGSLGGLPAGRVTVSLGAVQATGPNCTEESLYKAADALLYEAKQSGRNRVCAQN